MPTEQFAGPICQSCGMPLAARDDFGTARDGSRAADFCHYCYTNGQFTNPDMTLPEMTDFCADVLVKRGMPNEKARALMNETLPMLKRWRTAVEVV